MTTAELKEYLAMVVQTEKEVNAQEQLFQQLGCKKREFSEQIEHLVYTITQKEKPVEPYRATTNEENAKEKVKTWTVILIGAIISFVVTPFMAWNGMMVLTVIFGFIAAAGLFAFIPAVLGIVTGVATGISKAIEKDEKIYEEALEKYKKQCNMYNELQKRNENAKEQIEKLKIQKQVVEAYHQQVENSLASSRRNLEKMYSYNIVFPKYRNYVMVSSIYEYLCAGRCTTLEGHEGAYNILELEIRLDRIITRLDDILRDLAAIQANQYTLYSCLQDSNQKIDMLLREESRMADGILRLGTQASAANARLESLQRSSELTNYLTECNQRELHYMNRMNYLAGHYDNPYGNYTPV